MHVRVLIWVRANVSSRVGPRYRYTTGTVSIEGGENIVPQVLSALMPVCGESWGSNLVTAARAALSDDGAAHFGASQAGAGSQLSQRWGSYATGSGPSPAGALTGSLLMERHGALLLLPDVLRCLALHDYKRDSFVAKRVNHIVQHVLFVAGQHCLPFYGTAARAVDQRRARAEARHTQARMASRLAGSGVLGDHAQARADVAAPAMAFTAGQGDDVQVDMRAVHIIVVAFSAGLHSASPGCLGGQRGSCRCGAGGDLLAHFAPLPAAPRPRISGMRLYVVCGGCSLSFLAQ